jgi:hypothetical protein
VTINFLFQLDFWVEVVVIVQRCFSNVNIDGMR